MRNMQRIQAISETPSRLYDALLRRDLSAFTQKVFNTVSPNAVYKHNWHIDAISEYLTACSRGEITRLIINMPPRMMKSISVSVAWPAWLLGNNPAERIMCASYANTLSLALSQDCRLVCESEWYKNIFPEFELAADQNTKSKFQTTMRGARFATSTGSSSTGMGGNFLIVDDPVDPKRAASERLRNAANTWFRQTFSTRLDDKEKGVIVVVMQRLHQDDLSGNLLKDGGWEHLCLPWEATNKTVIFFPTSKIKFLRKKGDILHEQRINSQQIEKEKKNLGTYGFSGQYQQSPTPQEGGIFKETWFSERYASLPKNPLRIVQSWDTAYKPGELNDPSVCTTWFLTEESAYLADVLVQRLIYPDLKSTAISHAAKWGCRELIIENKGSGQSLIQDLSKMPGFSVHSYTPIADKITRAAVISPIFENKKIVLPVKESPWLLEYLEELLLFPMATHDDQVDSTSQFIDWWQKQSNHSYKVRSL